MSEYKLKFTPDQLEEVSMVDIAFEILKAANTPMYYRDLMQEIAKVKGLTDEQILEVIAQVYTEINIDGRFACVGQNLWGLKRWYPVEKGDETVAGANRPRIINDDDEEEEEIFAEEEFDEEVDEEDFDVLDEDVDFVDDDEVDDALDDEEPEEPVDLDEELDEEEPDPDLIDFDEDDELDK